MLGRALRNGCVSSSSSGEWKLLGFKRGLCSLINNNSNSNSNSNRSGGLLNLGEVEKILEDVKADNVKIINLQNTTNTCSFTDHVVIATGRSAWHVRNIAQALFYKAKEKQKGFKRMLLPSVQGQEGGKWIVVDSGSLVIHALDEKMRAYYNLEALWTKEKSTSEESQDVATGLVKVRRKNNSKKRPAKSA